MRRPSYLNLKRRRPSTATVMYETKPKIIYADFREGRCKVPSLLSQAGFDVRQVSLAADYSIGPNYLVERKTVADFVTSIADGRLFRQIKTLATACRHPLLVLEGGGLYLQKRISANVIRGTMIWITVKKQVPLLRTCSEGDTASLLALLFKYADGSKRSEQSPPVYHQRIISPWQRQLNILTQVPGLGRRLAGDLLANFKTVENLIKTPDAELLCLRGFGKGRLNDFRQIFPIV